MSTCTQLNILFLFTFGPTGAMDAIFAAVLTYGKENAKVAEVGSACIWNLASGNSTHCSYLIQLGTKKLLQTLITEWVDDKHVQYHANGALSKLKLED